MVLKSNADSAPGTLPTTGGKLVGPVNAGSRKLWNQPRAKISSVTLE